MHEPNTIFDFILNCLLLVDKQIIFMGRMLYTIIQSHQTPQKKHIISLLSMSVGNYLLMHTLNITIC